MAKTGRFLHSASDTTDKAAVGTTYDVAKDYDISLHSGIQSGSTVGGKFTGRIEAVVIRLTSISGAASITMKGTMTRDGVLMAVLPDTAATIALETGSATIGTVAYLAGLDWIADTDTLTIVCKTDAGTVTLDACVVTWSE